MYVRTWTFHVDTINFEGVRGSKQNLYHDPHPDPGSEQNFDFLKNFAERHQIWWISLAYKK